MASLTSLRLQATIMSSAFAQASRHRLLTQDGFGLSCCGRHHHLRVLKVPGADADDIQLLYIQHLAVVLVALGDAELVPEGHPRLLAGIRQRYHLRALDVLPAYRVPTRNVSGCDESDTVLRHGSSLLESDIGP